MCVERCYCRFKTQGETTMSNAQINFITTHIFISFFPINEVLVVYFITHSKHICLIIRTKIDSTVQKKYKCLLHAHSEIKYRNYNFIDLQLIS